MLSSRRHATVCESLVKQYHRTMVLTITTKAILTIFSILQGTILCQEIGMKNVALHKPANQSHTWNETVEHSRVEWVAKRAVDDCLIRDFYKYPYCCSATVNKTNNYWHVNLEDEYQVQRIVIYGRHDNTGGGLQLKGFKLDIYNSSNSDPEEILNGQQPVEVSNVYRINFTHIQLIKELRITLDIALTLCEVQVFALCDDGNYGINCSSTCGNCSENETCDRTTGECPGGCSSSVKPPFCNETCDNGTWGVNCTDNCGQCRSGTVCDVVNGECPFDCNPGWKGKLCNESCEDGNFGTNCSYKCGNCYNATCNKTTGYCPDGCDSGWKFEDPFCNAICDDGYYGMNCTSICGNCSENAECYKTTGECPGGCSSSWKPPFCKETCDSGTWGVNCSNKCGQCLNDTACDALNGECPFYCNPGWKGIICNETCEDGNFGTNCSYKCGNCFNATCNKTTGYCPDRCDSGWKFEDPFCNTTCEDGDHGIDCTLHCGECNGDATCHKTTGECPGGCKYGWKPPLCNAVCDDGTWGENCSSECQNCLNDNKCDTVNGFCPNGCTAGWREPTCNTTCSGGTWGLNCSSNCGFCKESQICDTKIGLCPAGCIQSYEPPLCKTEKLQDGTNGNAAAIGGSVAGVIVICAVIGAIVVWKIRKSRRKDDSLTQKLDDQINPVIGLPVDEVDRFSAQDGIQLDIKETQMGYATTKDNTVDSTTSIPIAELRGFCRSNCFQEGPLYIEFDKLPRGMLYGAMAAKDPDNMKRNRYKDMIAYDKNRVKLPVTDTAVGTDYINASYVEGYQKGRMKYIASQGVMDNIIDAFWLMIWSSDIHNIIMLTNCTEGGRLKCKQYWPNEGEHQYGGICVSLEEEQRYAEYTIRTFSCKRGTNGAVRTIIQFHYTAWPDKNVPNYPLSLVRFWNRVKSSQTAAIIPWLVHCSAGVGRTGTFIALDCLYEQAQMEGKVDIFKSVNYLREQRVNMVQTPAQYVFLYQAVLDAVQPTGQLCSTEGFSDLLVDLMKQSPDSQITNLEVEFQKLQMDTEDQMVVDQVMGMDNQNIYHNLTVERFAHSLLPENKTKIRDDKVLPDDQYRPLLGTFVEGHNDYINAVYLETHRHSAGLIITQTPLRDTMIDFYRLLWDNHVVTVVMMDSDHDNEKVGCYWNLSSTTTSIDPFSLVLTSEVKEEFYLSREIQISLRGETRHLKMFQYTDWSTRSSNPQHTGSMLQLLDSVSKSGNSPMDAPIVVHCLNGADKSGLFCVLWTVFERMKEDNEVAVADTVKMMRVRRPQIIPTLEQYKFCYTVIQEYLESSTTYANVL